MASSQEASCGNHDFDLASLYQQLKEVELMDQRTRTQISDHHRWRSELLCSFTKNNETENSNARLPEELLDEHRKILVDFRKALDTYRCQLRKTINTYSRPGLRPLGILDLPDEILM
jgi:hypothetical protein